MKQTRAWVALLALWSSPLGAQDAVEFIDGVVLLPGGAAIRIGGEGGAAPAAAAAGQAESPRLAALKALVYDRRPSAILKAWSSPWPPPEPTEEDVPSDGEAASQPASAPAASAPAATPEQAAEQAAAEAAAAKASAEQKAIQLEARDLQRAVTLGRWDEVRTYLRALSEAEGKAAYRQMVTSLQNPPEPPQPPFPQYLEKHHFAPGDLIGLCEAAPFAFEKQDLQGLGRLVALALAAGAPLDACVAGLRERAAAPEAETRLDRRAVARILFEANQPLAAGEFLPEPEAAIADNDREALNLLSRYYLARHDEDPKTGHLEQAWRTTQAVLAAGEVSEPEKVEGLKRAVDLAPRIKAELGASWLNESFTARPERGMEILAVIGGAASKALRDQGREAEPRQKLLELQTTAADALLAAAPERAQEWKQTLDLLAGNWLREAGHSYQYDQSTRRGPSLQRDYYGNFFYYQQQFQNREDLPASIETAKLLEIRPADSWRPFLDAALLPRLDARVAQLLLKVGEESEAFPFIERLAADQPKQAKELVDEFLRVFAKNHDPNSENRRTNPYMFIYGFESRANSIPLTRSKQERNLRELAGFVERLKKLPVELDQELLTSAFVTAHSTAEVYRIETIEQVFGSLAAMAPKSLAQLAHRMRSNLAEVWRDPATQKDKGTRRRQQDIQAEVLRGYEVARAVLDDGLERHAGDWSLLLAAAALDHDENAYRQEIAPSSEFSARREAAFGRFQAAAEAYRAKAAELAEDEETAEVYETWFYAGLGACDLGSITHEKQPATPQFELIRDALAALPAAAAERHRGLFANSLFTRMSNVNPAVKYRYVKSGLEIAGEHERTREAREVLDYYRDLLTEIALEVRIDGSDQVGHGRPFGAFVDLRHTKEIERESGGFSKYLVNQNNQGFSYNYGRPTEDYRTKFEEAARAALAERFQVLSVTFNHPDAHSRSAEEYGWRVTPYAYLLLKPLGPEVDRIPPLRLDLDFLDTTGYAVIPVESAPVPIDARAEAGEPRPFEQLAITQTLDERQARNGKLLLEVKATARGLVPDLAALLDVAPAGFRVAAIDDPGVSITEFDKEGAEVRAVSDRTWMLSLVGREDLEQLPESFAFGTARVPEAALEYQRFVDADLAKAGPVIELEHAYGRKRRAWELPLAIGAAALLLGLGYVAWRRRRGPARGPGARFKIPEPVTAFTVIGLLRDIEQRNGLDARRSAELESDIARIERAYFQEAPSEPADLAAIAERWVSEAR